MWTTLKWWPAAAKPLVLVVLFVSSLCFSHGGGLDAQGGHHNRKTGDYHCHREPCQSATTDQRSEAAQPPGQGFVALYDRSEWPHWIDEDGDCQDTRAEILIDQSEVSVKFKRNRGCVVSWGRWTCPYTSGVFTKASDVDIDHLVPLKHAHGHGGDGWSRSQRRAFANDPMNLLVVSDNENQSKGAKGPDSWKPPNKDYWCDYAQRWERVKEKYGLYQTPPEKRALAAMRAACH